MPYVRAMVTFFVRTLSFLISRLLSFWNYKSQQPETARIHFRSTKEPNFSKLEASSSTPSLSLKKRHINKFVHSAALFSQFARTLRDKDKTIDILHRKLDFLSGEIKLKNLRIENLVSQVKNFSGICLQKTRPYVTGSKQPRMKTKMPLGSSS